MKTLTEYELLTQQLLVVNPNRAVATVIVNFLIMFDYFKSNSNLFLNVCLSV